MEESINKNSLIFKENAAFPLSVDEVLYKLLYSKTFRTFFLKGNLREIGINEELELVLSTIDKVELVRLARRISYEIMSGSNGGQSGIRDVFPNLIRVFEKRGYNINDLIEHFLESSQFIQYRDIPFSGKGISLIEAFYNFSLTLKKDLINEDNFYEWLQHEYMIGIFSSLTVNHNPNFEILDPEIKFNGCSYYSFKKYPTEFLNLIGKSIYTSNSNYKYGYISTSKRLVVGMFNEAQEKVVIINNCEKSINSISYPLHYLNDILKNFKNLGIIST